MRGKFLLLSFRNAEEVPAAFTFLGIRNETLGSVHGLHTPQFLLDESQVCVSLHGK